MAGGRAWSAISQRYATTASTRKTNATAKMMTVVWPTPLRVEAAGGAAAAAGCGVGLDGESVGTAVVEGRAAGRPFATRKARWKPERSKP